MSNLLNFILSHEEAFKSKGRLSSLYSDFRFQQATNPDGYRANIAAWRKALAEASRAGVFPSSTSATTSLLSIETGEELLRALTTREWGRPLALQAVIQEAVANKELIPLNEFTHSKTSIYSRSWIPTPWQALTWSLRQLGVLGNPGAGDKLVVGRFVVVANLEAAAEAILRKVNSIANSQVDRIFSTEAFATQFSQCLSQDLALSHADTDILLRYLSRDKPVLTYNTTTVKFKIPSEPTTSPITHEDETIASLRTLMSTLEAQIPLLEKKISDLNIQARSAVTNKSRTSALSALRSKKTAETTLVQRMNTLAQIEGVYDNIQTATDQVAIVRVMKESATVLRGLNKQVGGVEGVEDVVDSLKEEMGKVDEIQNVITEAGSSGVIDETEVDEEFEALEREEKEKLARAEAEKTEKRLRELDAAQRELERAQAAVEAARRTDDKQQQAQTEAVLEKDVQQLRRLSIDADATKPVPSADTPASWDGNKEREPVLAT